MNPVHRNLEAPDTRDPRVWLKWYARIPDHRNLIQGKACRWEAALSAEAQT